MNIYIKPVKKLDIAEVRQVVLKDVAEISAGPSLTRQLEKLEVFTIPEEKKQNYLLSVIDIINKINSQYKEATIINLGESDIIIDYAPKHKKDSKLKIVTKIVFVCMTLFAGSSTAIMTFHNESQLSVIFSKYNEVLFGGHSRASFLALNISYSVGLISGILIFFNHVLGKKITDDPTPIEVELTTYENDVIETVKDVLSEKQENNR